MRISSIAISEKGANTHMQISGGSTAPGNFAKLLDDEIEKKRKSHGGQWELEKNIAYNLGIGAPFLSTMRRGRNWPSRKKLVMIGHGFGWTQVEVDNALSAIALDKVAKRRAAHVAISAPALVDSVTRGTSDARRIYALRRDSFYRALPLAEALSNPSVRSASRVLNLTGKHGYGLSSLASALCEGINGRSQIGRIAFDISLKNSYLWFQMLDSFEDCPQVTIEEAIELVASDILQQVNVAATKRETCIAELDDWLRGFATERPLLVLRDAENVRGLVELIEHMSKIESVRFVIATQSPLVLHSVVGIPVPDLSSEEIIAVARELTPDLDVSRAADRIAELRIGIDNVSVLLAGLRFKKCLATGSDDVLTQSDSKLLLIRDDITVSSSASVLPDALRLLTEVAAPDVSSLLHVLVAASIFDGRINRDDLRSVLDHVTGECADSGGADISDDKLDTAILTLGAFGWLDRHVSEDGCLIGIRHGLRDQVIAILDGADNGRYIASDAPILRYVQSAIDVGRIRTAFVLATSERISRTRRLSGWPRTKAPRQEEASLLIAAKHAHRLGMLDALFAIAEKLCLVYGAKNSYTRLPALLVRFSECWPQDSSQHMRLTMHHRPFIYLKLNNFRAAIACFPSDGPTADHRLVNGICGHLLPGTPDPMAHMLGAISALKASYLSSETQEQRAQGLLDLVHGVYWRFRVLSVSSCRIDQPSSFEQARSELSVALALADRAQDLTYLTLLRLWGARLAFISALLASDIDERRPYRADMQRFLIASKGYLVEGTDQRVVNNHRFLWSLLEMLDTLDTSGRSVDDLVKEAARYADAANDGFWISFFSLMVALFLCRVGRHSDAKDHLVRAVVSFATILDGVSEMGRPGAPPILLCSMMHEIDSKVGPTQGASLAIAAWCAARDYAPVAPGA